MAPIAEGSEVGAALPEDGNVTKPSGPCSSREIPTALVVEDEDTTRLLVSASLAKAGFEVEAVENGEQALSAFRRRRPDLVLLDLLLPGMDGFAFLETLRNLPAGRTVPVLVATVLEDGESIRRAYDAGATDFITKPINWTILGHRARYVLRASRAYEGLCQAESRYRQLFEGVPVGLFRTTPEGRLLDANRILVRLRGCADREELLATPPAELYVNPKDRDRFVARMKKDGMVRNFEIRMRRADGEIRWVEINAIVVPGPDGRTMIFEGSLHDIHDRKRAEGKLRESEKKYRDLVETAHDLIWSLDRQGRITFVNQAASNVYGYPPEELVGRSFLELVPPEDRIRQAEHLSESLASGENLVLGVETEVLDRDGNRHTLVANAAIVRDQHGNAVGVTGTSTDVTERKRVENELRQSRKEMRELASYLQNALENERTRVARELHDEFGQALTGIRIDLAWIADRLPGHDASLREKMTRTLKMIDGTFQTVRRISADLRPAILDDLGIGAAIEWQAGEFTRRTGIPCEVFLDPEEIVLDREHSTAFYRILQESLTNVARHACAARVVVRLAKEADLVRLEIEDDGKGISREEITDSRSFGLIGMRERVLPLRGAVDIEGAPGKGTTISVRLPLEAAGVCG